jgi:hypothetical protein
VEEARSTRRTSMSIPMHLLFMFNPCSYFEHMNLDAFDALIIVIGERFSETDRVIVTGALKHNHEIKVKRVVHHFHIYTFITASSARATGVVKVSNEYNVGSK